MKTFVSYFLMTWILSSVSNLSPFSNAKLLTNLTVTTHSSVASRHLPQLRGEAVYQQLTGIKYAISYPELAFVRF